ncbi:MerR family transcriptional regulator [Cryomorpha ignava]|uniref:MerR family transcriptional regulator n=1 Tax=Cryomorpha ignava TaxID=101383 RepID=A0A7K3WKB3_9FLAO|nr:MerR family transcriptional regulator [Cryomorpha ignava]NEN22087.1 MerR family transcriptional regulator [Cryomorpha ignava]
MITYSIKDLERLSGIKAHTIRIWEKRYELIFPKRTATNIRYYDGEDLKQVLNIAILNRSGIKISKIAKLSSDELTEKVLEVGTTDSSEEAQIESLLISMIEFDDKRFESVLTNCTIRMGFEDTVIKVIYPFFKKVGLLWQLDSINPAQEHYISNIIRQKIIVAIDGLSGNAKSGAKTFLLFLQEGELHELGLLFYNYLILKAGHKVMYLGQSVPLENVVTTASQFTVSYLVTSIHSSFLQEDFMKRLNSIGEELPHIPVILTNRIEFDISSSTIDQLYVNLSPEAFNEMLNTDKTTK